MQINNHQIVDYDAVLDAKFGAEGTPERAEAEEKAYAFYTGQIIEDARKKAKITRSRVSPTYRFRPFLYFKSGKWSDRT